MLHRLCLIFALSVAAAGGSACGPNERIMQSSAERSEPTPSTAKPETSTFERDLDAMRNADFYLVYAFRRKDGAVLDADDRSFASAVIPPEINRRMVSDQGRAILIGSNFKLPEDSMKALSERFAITDLSTKELPQSPAR